MKGDSPDYLDLGKGYDGFSNAFTFTAWVRGTVSDSIVHILDLGNGALRNKIIFQIDRQTTDLGFINMNGSTSSVKLNAPSALKASQWRFVAVTVVNGSSRIYLDGMLTSMIPLSAPISKVIRTRSFLGKSNWSQDGFFRGAIDEPVLAKVARQDDWIRLSFTNQKQGQKLVAFRSEEFQSAQLQVPSDRTLLEGQVLELTADAVGGKNPM